MKTHPAIHPIVMLATAAFAVGNLAAAVKPNPLFSDGAVLQRGQSVPVWGTANDGEKVTVELGDQKLTTTAKNGTWRVDLQPLSAGGPFTMTVSGENTVKIENLLVGEVWVCSGQSNMAWPLDRIPAMKEEAPKANFPKIRMFTVKKRIAIQPCSEAEGSWVECSPTSVGSFSAVGYYFARDLYQKLGIPVGMIHTSWGGTPAQAWTSVEGFGTHPELAEYVQGVKKSLANHPAAVAAYPAKLKKFEAAKKAWDDSVKDALNAWTAEMAKAKQEGKPLPPRPAPTGKAPTPPALPEGTQGHPSTLFNGMIAPIIPYAIKGSIWYQGEANSGRALRYRTLFPAMIADWRKRWKQGDFPFLFVQIAPHNGMTPEIREAQMLTLTESKNTAMTVITDAGNPNNIHPVRKEPVGQRLALAARAIAYGEKIEYSGPLYQSMEAKDGKVALSFSHTGSGLVAKGGDLKGFTIAGVDGKFIPAKAEINDSKVIVSAEGVADPKAVRYGWANVPDVNLFNKEGLPASPFRTDVEGTKGP